MSGGGIVVRTLVLLITVELFTEVGLLVGLLRSPLLFGELSRFAGAAGLSLDTVMGEDDERGVLLFMAMSSSFVSFVDELFDDSLLAVLDLCGILKLLALKLAIPGPRPKANAVAEGGVLDFILVSLLSSVSPAWRCLSFWLLTPESVALATDAAGGWSALVSEDEASFAAS